MSGIPISDAVDRAAIWWGRPLRSAQANTRAPWPCSRRSPASRWHFSCGRSLPADGSMSMVERASWAPSLGIEYHLGVDGLGALMLVLSAIVTLMSVDAAHRVHHQPGLYFRLCSRLSRDSSDRSPR